MNGLARGKALLRISKLFKLRTEEIRLNQKFGLDLQPSFVSDFKNNELDMIIDDINEIKADQAEFVKVTIETVDDYCSFVEQYSLKNAKGFLKLAKRWEKEWKMENVPAWRKLIFNIIGV